MDDLTPIIVRRKRQDLFVKSLGIACTLLGIVTLATLILKLLIDGLPRLNWQFLTSYHSYQPVQAGILAALVGSLLLMVVTAATAIPLGVAAGLYLEEYAPKNR